MNLSDPFENAVFYHPPDIQGSQLLHARYLTQSFSPHFHEAYAIGVVEAGALSNTYGRERLVIPAGHLMVINPYEIHTGVCMGSQGVLYWMLYLPINTLKVLLTQLGLSGGQFPAFPTSSNAYPLAAFSWLQLCQTLVSPSSSPIENQSRLLTALADLVSNAIPAGWALPSPPRSESAALHPAIDFIHANLAEELTLDQLAQTVRLSPYHFLRLFKQQVGLPPHTYILQLRIELAKRLLSAPRPRRRSLSDIAIQTGFYDQAHFSRKFKRLVGVTPRQFALSFEDECPAVPGSTLSHAW